MSTRSNIIVEHRDGTFKSVFCHLNGHLDGVGQTLLDRYNDQVLAEALVEPGHLEVLSIKCMPPPDRAAHRSLDHRVPGYSLYLGRDCGLPNCGPIVGRSLDEVRIDDDRFGVIEYLYVWRVRDGWFVEASYPETNGLMKLPEAIELEFGENQQR